MTPAEFESKGSRRTVRYRSEDIRSFLDWLVSQQNLPVGKSTDGIPSPMSQFGPEPSFMIAKTGVGKTVAMPVYELLHAIRNAASTPGAQPCVYVVEPRVPICESNHQFLNTCWNDFHRELRDHGSPPPLFGCITEPTGRLDDFAPILFVTTGIFESLLLRTPEELPPPGSRFLIDEAHVTIQQNAGVEIAIAVARKGKVPVSFMSATVDPEGLDRELGTTTVAAGEERYPILFQILDGPLNSKAPDETAKTLEWLVETVLLNPTDAAFTAPAGARGAQVLKDVRSSLVDSADRAVGMLIIVNSHNPQRSDTRVIGKLLRGLKCNQISRRVEVLTYASEVSRNRDENEAFIQRIHDIEARRGRYVIVATNVVEMGVTFQSTDIVVTLASELETVETPDGSYLRKRALAVNSLLQRAGRAGRRRPGVCYVARDFPAPYLDGSPPILLSETVQCERLVYPLEDGPYDRLAAAAARLAPDDPIAWISELPLPSALRDDGWLPRASAGVRAQLQKLDRTGYTKSGRLTDDATFALNHFPKITHPALATMVARVCRERRHLLDVAALFAAAWDVPLRELYELSGDIRRNGYRASSSLIFPLEDIGAAPAQVRDILNNEKSNIRDALSNLGIHPAMIERLAVASENDFVVPKQQSLDPVDASRFLILEKSVFSLSQRSDFFSIYSIVEYALHHYFSQSLSRLATQLDRRAIRARATAELAILNVNGDKLYRLVRVFDDIRRRAAQAVARQTQPTQRAAMRASERELLFQDELVLAARMNGILSGFDGLAGALAKDLMDVGQRVISADRIARLSMQYSCDVDANTLGSVVRLARDAVRQEERLLSQSSEPATMSRLDAQYQDEFLALVAEMQLLRPITLELRDGRLSGTAATHDDGEPQSFSLRTDGSAVTLAMDKWKDHRSVELMARARLIVRDGNWSKRTIELAHLTSVSKHRDVRA